MVANPVTVTLDGLDITIRSTFTFEKGSGKVITTREILNDLHGEEVAIEEYFTGAFGTTEYQADMTKLTLGVGKQTINFTYHGKKIVKQNTKKGLTAYVNIPDVMTKVEMGGDADTLEVEEGIAFSPVYHIKLTKTLSKGTVQTWLKLAKAN